jgi:hypothetical protein
MTALIRTRAARKTALFFLISGLIWAFSGPAHAQTTAAASRSGQSNTVTQTVDQDADSVRDHFTEMLRRDAPSLGQILRLDPSLMSREDYLTPYPNVQAFLKQHPEIVRNPSYYLAAFSSNYYYQDSRSRAWEDIMTGFFVFVIMVTILGALGWLIRMAVDYRRWGRLAKVQAEVHTKLLDRFTGNEELLSYVKSPAGAKFLESAPINLDGGPRQMTAPFNRILFSMQAGVVLAAAGIGMNIVSRRVDQDAADPVYMISVLLLSVGIGFFASAGLSFLLSRRLGLINQEHLGSTNG